MSAHTPARRPLMPLEAAWQQFEAAAHRLGPLAVEMVPTLEAQGRILAKDVVSLVAVPPADNSAMDGYALHLAPDLASGSVLPVSQRITAGVVGQPLAAGTAARIFTGAQIPPGADAVLMQEWGEAFADGSPLGAIRVDQVPAPGQWIRRRGEDVAPGQRVLGRGTRLAPQHLGVAAAVGYADLPVMRQPRVALFTTGDELVMPGAVPPQALPPGAIFNSNRFTLCSLLREAGCAVSDLGIVPDRFESTRAALQAAAAEHDLVITSGGVSVGEEDHVRPAVMELGHLDLWSLDIKPGKPLAFGGLRRPQGGECLFVGLPGNPVSSLVTHLVAVVPLLRAVYGRRAALPTPLLVRAGFDWPRPDGRREFLRVLPDAAGQLALYENQGSGVLTSVAWAAGLVDNPGGQPIAVGDAVRYLPLAELMQP